MYQLKIKKSVTVYFLEKFNADNPNVANNFKNFKSTDDVILALLD